MDQKIRKTHSADGTQIAYAVLGSGEPLVKTATYITHLEHDWQNPTWRPFLKGLARFHTLIRYDERGNGLSDWYSRDYSWDTWIEDLKAVVDAEGLETFNLFGQSQGSTVAVAFAARYPERVKKLIILGGYARGWLHRDLSETGKREEQMLIDMIRLGWGKDNPAFRKFFSAQIMPDAADHVIQAFNELMKISTEPEIAAQLEREMHLSNVVEEAANVKCPTLILHPQGDASIPFKEGKLLAELIPNARFVRLNSNNHILQETEPAWTEFWREVYEFLGVKEPYEETIRHRSENIRRALRVILFTDIVSSTEMVLELGDRKWIELLEKHTAIVTRTVQHYNGEIIKDTGDGFLVTFETATEALECSLKLITALAEENILIRGGLHAGEIEFAEGDIRGANVHIASRLLGYAGSKEIWTSDTLKEITQNVSFEFMEMGRYNLKGIPGNKMLYQVSRK